MPSEHTYGSMESVWASCFRMYYSHLVSESTLGGKDKNKGPRQKKKKKYRRERQTSRGDPSWSHISHTR